MESIKCEVHLNLRSNLYFGAGFAQSVLYVERRREAHLQLCPVENFLANARLTNISFLTEGNSLHSTLLQEYMNLHSMAVARGGCVGANAPPRGTGSSAFGQGCGKFRYRKWVLGVPLILFSVLSLCYHYLILFDVAEMVKCILYN